jgi:hypothetical protein
LILDDFCYARKDQAETGVLFELIAARYERRSLLVTANKPFGSPPRACCARFLRNRIDRLLTIDGTTSSPTRP